jgi:tetratricopeptide (TPR) repeat protein
VSAPPIDDTVQMVRRAQTLCDLCRYGDAVTMLSAAIAREPRNSQAWCLMARVQLGQGHQRAALQAARAAGSLAPLDGTPLSLASLALGRLGQLREAVSAAEQAARLQPRSARAHARLAQTLAQFEDRLGEAELEATRSLELGPDQVEAHMAAGAVAAAAGRRAQAVESFGRALALDPQNRAVHDQLTNLPAGRRFRWHRPRSLASTARRVKGAVLANPGAVLSRRSFDAVSRSFLVWMAYFLLVAAVIALLAGGDPGSPAQLGPLVMLAAAGVFGIRFIAMLDGDLRRRLRRILATGLVATATGLEALALAALVAGAASTQANRQTWAMIAILSAAVARIVLHAEQRRAF